MYIDQVFRVFGKDSQSEKNTAILKKPERGNAINTQRILNLLIWNHQNNKITYSPVKITPKTDIALVSIILLNHI